MVWFLHRSVCQISAALWNNAERLQLHTVLTHKTHPDCSQTTAAQTEITSCHPSPIVDIIQYAMCAMCVMHRKLSWVMRMIHFACTENNWCFWVKRQFAQYRSSDFTVLCLEVQTDYLCPSDFLCKCIKLYVGILCHVNSGSKSSKWFTVNSDLYRLYLKGAREFWQQGGRSDE
jgi:hypothetical protein